MTKVHFVKNKTLNFVAASHEDPGNPGVLKKILIDSGLGISGNLQMVNWARMEAGKGFCKHYHQDMSEVFVIISGQARMLVDQTSYAMESGDAIVVPPNSKHEMLNLGSDPVEYIVFGLSAGTGGKTVTG